MFATIISIAILIMEFAIIFASLLKNVQEDMLATIPSVIKTVLLLMIVARTNIVMGNN